MNALERTLIEKAGYDNGWEVTVNSEPDQVVLASALHHARTIVTPSPSNGKWLLTVPGGLLSRELAESEPDHHLGQDQFGASDDRELGRLLRHAAGLARSLPDLPEVRFAEAVARELPNSLGATEVERLVRQRIGQDIFRGSLMDFWGGSCAVTGIAVPELLRASHIRPWTECESDAERLNVFNGFLLVAHLDALFDRHLMTFTESGEALFAPTITPEVRMALGLKSPLGLRRLSPGHLPFLRRHNSIFQRINHPGGFGRTDS